METIEVIEGVINGDFDDGLHSIQEAIRERLETKARVSYHTLKPGDKVTFVDTIRPKYLRNVIATVREKGTKRIVVDLDRPYGRFHKGVTVPPALITKADG